MQKKHILADNLPPFYLFINISRFHLHFMHIKNSAFILVITDAYDDWNQMNL